MLSKLSLKKKHKYLVLSVTIAGLLFGFSFTIGVGKVVFAILTILVATLGAIWAQYEVYSQHNIQTLLNTVLLPVYLVVGSLLSLIYFPNLGLPTRILALMAVGAVMYILSLVTNIFLVVIEREEPIPLYRVALTWAQILLVVIAIPYFAGLFKLPVNGVIQNLLSAGTAFLFAHYLIWSQGMDRDFPEIAIGERTLFSLIVAFVIFVLGTIVSFIPTESFLRSLFVSAGLMASLGYLQAHYKNAVNKKLVLEYLVILVIFLLLTLLF